MIGPGPHLICGYLVSLESTPEMSLWSVRPFLYGSQLCLIHNRQTHRPWIIVSYRPYLMVCIAMWHNNTEFLLHSNMPSVLWRCWLGGRKGIRPVKKQWWGAGVVICPEQRADLHIAQLMPLPLTVSCFSKVQIGFTFLVPAHLGSPGERAVKWVCVCVVT